jgi:DNA-binding MarR family transcriptional regulator
MDLASELDQRLRALQRVVRGAADYGMSLTAASVLAQLADHGPQRVTDLAAAEAVAQPTMTTLVRRLERDGLVERAPHETDRRAILIALTAEGAGRLERVRAARAGVLAERLDRLDPRRRAALEDLLPLLDHLI